MRLSSSFRSQDWTVQYGLFEPASSAKDGSSHQRTVVFVHGTPWSSYVFRPLAQTLLSAGLQVLLYDLPGYGQSQTLDAQATAQDSKFAGDTSVRTQGAVLADLLEHLKLDGHAGNTAPMVIAHDIAGAIALRTHIIHGCDFASLMLLDTNAVLPWGDGFYKLVRSEPDAFAKLPSGIFEAVVRAVIQSACYDPRRLASGAEDALAGPWIPHEGNSQTEAEEKQRSFVRQIAQANDTDVAEMLDSNSYANVRCDAKILWGEQDQWIPREKMESLAEKMKHCVKEFVIVPEAGHLVMVDQPERVTYEILLWLLRQGWISGTL